MLNVRVSPLISDALGWKLYDCPASTLVSGVPLIVGGELLTGAACTWIEKTGSWALVVPSLTLILMLLWMPTLPLAGVPLNRPVDWLKLAQAGLPVMENVRALPSASDADGWKL